jgi:hypothetical protein
MPVFRLAAISKHGQPRPVVLAEDRIIDVQDALKVRQISAPAVEGRLDILPMLDDWDHWLPVLQQIAAVRDPSVTIQAADATFLAPIRYPRKLLLAGANYTDHVKEMGAPPPSKDTHRPFFFLKPPTVTVVGPNEPRDLPSGDAHSQRTLRTSGGSMFTIGRSLPVNDRNNPPQVILTRDQVWQGLVFKAENAVPFVPGMTVCEVLERSGQELVRECVYKGDRLRERVTFHPQRAVDFERLSGNVRGTIRNEIEEDENGALHLRFTFSLAVQGIAHNSPEEHAYATAMEGDYVRAIGATLTTIRQLVAEGKL